MRRSLGPALVAIVTFAAPAPADDAVLVRLKVGETRTGVGTVRPICDAPSVAIIEGGAIRAVGPGETLCSVATLRAQGTRALYRVIVTAQGMSDRHGSAAGREDGQERVPSGGGR